MRFGIAPLVRKAPVLRSPHTSARRCLSACWFACKTTIDICGSTDHAASPRRRQGGATPKRIAPYGTATSGRVTPRRGHAPCGFGDRRSCKAAASVCWVLASGPASGSGRDVGDRPERRARLSARGVRCRHDGAHRSARGRAATLRAPVSRSRQGCRRASRIGPTHRASFTCSFCFPLPADYVSVLHSSSSAPQDFS
jgi:hypothetical protein